MLAAVLTCDFLVSPAFASSDDIEQRVDDLNKIKRVLDRDDHLVVIEDAAVEKLVLANQFPADNLFQRHLEQAGVRAFSARDVAKTINRILDRATEVSRLVPQLEIDVASQHCAPAFQGIEDARRECLENLLVNLATRKAASSVYPHVLHSCEINNFNSVTINLTLKYMFPEGGREFPWQFSTILDFSQRYADLLGAVDCDELYLRAVDASGYQFAIYLAARKRRLEEGLDVSEFALGTFDLGTSFFASLERNQCAASQRFGRATFEAAAGLIAGLPKSEPKIFWSNESEARKCNEYSAYRLHITKGNEGMRLMYWMSPTGRIVLANVGTKGQLVIEDP